jgi:hypothetical protein
MRKAQELGVMRKDYAARFELDAQMLYQLQKPLVRRGALGPVRRRRCERISPRSCCVRGTRAR